MTSASPLWYRRTSWTEEDKHAFFAKLGRAKLKGEYLYLQASTLLSTDNKEHIQHALELISLQLEKYPEDFRSSSAYLLQAKILLKLNDFEAAQKSFRAALQARRKMPNMVTYAHLDYAWAIAVHRQKLFYDEAMAVLKEFFDESEFDFPALAYTYFGTLAIITEDLGDKLHAKKWAKIALERAAIKKGPFTRHPTAGVLDPKDINPEIHRLLWALAH